MTETIERLQTREIFRKSGGYPQCQILNWQKGAPPKFLACWDPRRQDHFIAAQRMGTWAEIDIYEVEMRLNGTWPEIHAGGLADRPKAQTAAQEQK